MNRLFGFVVLFFISCQLLKAQTSFVLLGDAKKISTNCFTVTQDLKGRKSAIWWPTKVNLNNDLELNFVVYLGKADPGADGMTFVFHNDPKGLAAMGSDAGGLTYGDHPDRAYTDKISPSVAIEMDTWPNPQCNPKDPAYDHTAIIYNGEMCNPKTAQVRLLPGKDNVENDSCYNARIKWNATTKTLDFYFWVKGTNTPNLILSWTDDLINNVFGGINNVYYGFTGSTGGAGNDQTICIFETSTVPIAKDDDVSTPYGTPVTVDVQINDFDSDGDKLFTTHILTQPKHGSAEILNRDKVKYSPFAGYAGLDSLEYRITDIDPLINGEKCYANTDAAWVYFNRVKCPAFTLKAEKLKDNNRCLPGGTDSGQGIAYMLNGAAPVTDGFVFKWYKGTLSAADLIGRTADYTGNKITNLASGPYTIYSKLKSKDADSCAFNLAFINIVPTEIKPDFNVVLDQEVTVCEPSNGAVSVKFVDAGIDTLNYQFTWYEVFPTPIGSFTKLKNLSAKKYDVLVLDLISGCSDLKSITVPKPAVLSPTIVPTVTPVTLCDKNNGTIKATVGGSSSSHTLYISKENDPEMILAEEFTTAENLAIGSYWVTAKNKITKCPVRDTIEVKVTDGKSYPVINTVNITHQTSCLIPSSPNGSFTVTDIDGNKPLTDYKFEFFDGNNTVTALVLPAKIDPSNPNKVINLIAGEYTVRVTNISTGCSAKRLVTIESKMENPSIHLISKSNQIKCSPVDGSISVDVDPDGNGPGTDYKSTGYTFHWWKGGVVKATPPDYTGSSLSNLPSGPYTVQAFSPEGCKASQTYTIDPPVAIPSVSITTNKPQQSCDPSSPNGSLTATNNAVAGFTYTYQWFKGIGTSTIMSGKTSLVLANVPAGDYTIRVTNNYNCSSTAFATISSLPATKPVVAIDLTLIKEQTICADPNPGPGQNKPNGEATASSLAGSNIEFRWFDGKFTASELVGKSPSFVGSTYKYLAAGEYTVVAVDNVNNCTSDPKLVTIPLNVPAITVDPQLDGISASNCSDNGGELYSNPVVSGGAVHTYAFFFYKGVPELPEAPYFNNATPKILPDLIKYPSGNGISGLTPTSYTVVVKDLTTGCWAFETKNLESLTPVPSVGLAPAVHNSICPSTPGAGNGVIDIIAIYPDKKNAPGVTISAANILADYDIYFDNGSGRVLTNKLQYTDLPAGIYTITAQEKNTPNQCESYPESIEIKNEADLKPSINFVASAWKTNCDPIAPNGALSLEITNPQGGDFTKYSYTLNGGSPVAFNSNPVVISGLDSRVYNVVVTNTNSTCTASGTAEIFDTHIDPPGAITNVIHKTQCTPNGSLSVSAPNLILYEYRWFKLTSGVSSVIGTQAGDEVVSPPLDSGTYQLQILDRNTKCTNTVEETIFDQRILPIVNVESTTFTTRCNGAYNGSATISLTPGSPFPANYQPLSWTFNGSPIAVAVSNTDENGNALQSHQFRATDLQNGNYVLTVANTFSIDCPESVSFEIRELIEIPRLTAIGIDRTSCTPNDAEIQILSQVPAGLINFEYKKILNGIESSPLDQPLTNLDKGEYTVTAQHPSNGCTTKPFQVEILDKTPNIQIRLVQLEHQISCNFPEVENGRIRIEVTPAGNYTYAWFKNGAPIPGANTVSISNLSQGDYRVDVSSNGCTFHETFKIKSTKKKIIPVIAIRHKTKCEGPSDGMLAASVDGATNGYTFTWTKMDDQTTYPSFQADNLSPGAYSLYVRDAQTTCDTTLYVSLEFKEKQMEIQATYDNPVTNCDITKGNGEVSMSANGDAAGYRYDWYETGTNNNSLVYTGSAFNELKPITYSVRVTDLITGCVKDQLVTPLFLPVRVPVPTLDSLVGVTSCIRGNAYAKVSVAGSTANHIFNWYIGNQVKASPDFEGFMQENLEEGEYLVVAVDRLSGCSSDAKPITIGSEKIYVDFIAATKNSLCQSNTGEAVLTWKEEVNIAYIGISDGVVEKPVDYELYELSHGEFEITIISDEGCVTKKKINIGADWFVYNGVSPNGDGYNDFLYIDCIELFPKNSIKIFNRTGTLVFAKEGYDNENGHFKGYGNKGIYATGNYLPDGSYYYIVDPGDGRKPSAGFFELLR